jgi:hypothetical protein
MYNENFNLKKDKEIISFAFEGIFVPSREYFV